MKLRWLQVCWGGDMRLGLAGLGGEGGEGGGRRARAPAALHTVTTQDTPSNPYGLSVILSDPQVSLG